MCGIWSYFSNTVTNSPKMEHLLHNLTWLTSIRGDHSTGFIYQTPDGVELYKKAIPGWDFVQLEMTQQILKDQGRTPYIIGHNRAATRGDVKSSNAHPFQFDHITGVHNGTLSNYSKLSPANVVHQVDSQHLYHGIADKGFAEIVGEAEGSFNLLWHDDEDDTIHMCRNETRPYTFAKIKGVDALIGASEKAMLKWLINRHGFDIQYCWTPELNKEYIWDVKEDMVKPKESIQHKGYVKPNPPVVVVDNTRATNVYQPSHQSAELIEFYLDTSVINQHLINGKRTYTVYGETIDNVPVMAYAVEEGELEHDTWYTARAWWTTSKKDQDHWHLQIETVKYHPLTSPDEAVHICVNCGNDHMESDGVFVDNAPLCLVCCKQFDVKEDQVDNDEAWKLVQLY